MSLYRIQRRALHRLASSRSERSWNELFADPALWWDGRCSNEGSRIILAAAAAGILPSGSSGLRAVHHHSTGREKQKSPAQFVAALKNCSKMRDLETGMRLHQEAVEAGFHTNKFVAGVLITMYSKCRNMALAQQVFDRMITRDVVAWTSLILGYVENGESSVALDRFTSMDCDPNAVTYLAAIKACGALASESLSEKRLCLEKGISIHKRIKDSGFESELAVATTLVDMYSKCSSMDRAREVFDGMIQRSVVTWTTLILGYVENGESSIAMKLFSGMDCKPDSVTFVAALKACGILANEKGSEKQLWLEKAVGIHKEVKERGFGSNMSVANTLVAVYGKCSSMQQAKEVFDRMTTKDVFTWNSLILGYVENGESSVAMDLFARMDCEPNSFTYVAALKACESLASEKESEKQSWLEKGSLIHKQVVDRGFGSNIAVANTLLGLYSKCGSLDRARAVFDGMISKDVVTWNTMILGYVENGESSVAIDLFAEMDCKPDSVTYLAALKACGGEKESEKHQFLEKGIAIHKKIRDEGFDADMAVANSLVGMYSRCGNMLRAREVFDRMVSKDVVTWNSLILGYVQNEESGVALDLFSRMECEASAVTYIAALKACGSLATEKESQKQVWLSKGIEIHSEVRKRAFDSKIVVATALLDMYRNCGSMHQARAVFDRMACKDVVAWNSLILGYVENGESLLALDLFASMDCDPNSVTYMAALKACGALNNSEKQLGLQKGIAIHKRIKNRGFDADILVATTLVDMYSKCGNMQLAREVFDSMLSKNVVTWTSLILGYLENGEPSAAMELFTRMDCEPSSITYMAALKACASLASEKQSEKQLWLGKGIAVHEDLKKRGFDCDLIVGNSLIDMYSKCGSTECAREVFDRMVTKDVVTWNSLILGYTDNGENTVATELFTKMDCGANSVTYVAALKACGSLAELQTGQHIHGLVCKTGLEQDPVMVAALVDFYGKCGIMNKAEEVFNNIQSPGIVPWNVLMAGYSWFGDSSRVFDLAKRMQEAGLQMDGFTFISILTACSHAGLVEEGKHYFELLSGCCGIISSLEHYNCMIDLLSRANRLQEALAVAKSMPFEADSVTWMTLLGACKKWKNVEIAKVAFDALMVCSGTKNTAAAYDLMREIFGSSRVVDCQDTTRNRLA